MDDFLCDIQVEEIFSEPTIQMLNRMNPAESEEFQDFLEWSEFGGFSEHNPELDRFERFIPAV